MEIMLCVCRRTETRKLTIFLLDCKFVTLSKTSNWSRISYNREILDTSHLELIAIGDRKLSIKRHSISRPEARVTVTGQQLMEVFWKNESALISMWYDLKPARLCTRFWACLVETTFHKHSFKATFSFQPSTAVNNVTMKTTAIWPFARRKIREMLPRSCKQRWRTTDPYCQTRLLKESAQL